jgi:uncharacterized protein (DUF1778 family)
MTDPTDPPKILSLVDAKAAAIAALDDGLMMEVVGVAMALDELRKALDGLETHLDERAFEEASHVGYQDVAHSFVYLQRTLAGLQTAAQQKEALISTLAQEANVAYETVAPYVEEKMQSALKKTETIALSAEDQRLFVDTLLNPPEPSDALRRAAQKYRELFGAVPSPRPRGPQKP